jgi:GR25 family glycosyltransferase involved in LPS biosynthesis
MSSICLNMIVKNESHIIEKTLNNLCNYFNFSYWVICDTGSTDDTVNIINNFFKEKNIKGELIKNVWVDFGYNRTIALQKAYNKTDYLLIFDADDFINGKLFIPKRLSFNVYNLKFGKDFCYKRPLLVNNRLKWEFKGVLHEFLSSYNNNFSSQTTIEGDYYIESGRTGNRSLDKDKYLKDAKILEKAYENEKDIDMKNRYSFYCAQSYKDCKLYEDSIKWYKKVLESNNWSQEKYYACLMIGDQYQNLGNEREFVKYYSKASSYDIDRIENIVRLVEYYYDQGNHLFVNMLYEKFKNYNKKPSSDKLFLDINSYENNLEYFNSISAFYVKDLNSGYESCKSIINTFINNEKNSMYLQTTINNILFYSNILENDKIDEIKILFNNINKKILEKDVIFDSNNLEKVWNMLYNRLEFYKYNKKIVSSIKSNLKTKKDINIMLTMTTCKRFNLFERTINSILNTWLDIEMIDYWFIVDDNSSCLDRSNMCNLYPFIDLECNNLNEKGHKNSMNIIYSKLKELKPKYWIHLEDDFEFYEVYDYISKGIECLDLLKTENVKQVLFNRNYGETVKDYIIKGHIENSKDFCVHDHIPNESFPYSNCKYWPHYSFRPSIIDTEAILSLGNYDTEEKFFELSYAKKWNSKGYKSAFFNKLTCLHTGRLTSQRGNKNIKNAYDLNDEIQFDDNTKFIKIINLERRKDRKERCKDILKKLNIFNYEFINAIDSREINTKTENIHFFKGNDFNNRKGFIACALSHYNLWLRLLKDDLNDFYLIMEDDFTLCKDFKRDINKIVKEMNNKPVLFLGYHMYEKNRNDYKNIYDSKFNQTYTKTGHVSIEKLDRNLFIGSTCCYSINKKGAEMMIQYIDKNGIKHGIDYLFKIALEIDCYETRPHLSFSEWNENNKKIDTDIQTDYTNLELLD